MEKRHELTRPLMRLRWQADVALGARRDLERLAVALREVYDALLGVAEVAGVRLPCHELEQQRDALAVRMEDDAALLQELLAPVAELEAQRAAARDDKGAVP